MSKRFKVGDRLKAIEFDKNTYEIDFVTITSINEKEKVYHWEAENLQLGGKIHSGYFFHEAVEYDEDEWGDGEDIDWDVTLLDGLEDEPSEWLETKIELDEDKNLIQLQQQLIELLMNQIVDLTLMSKIELGDDVIAEIRRLKSEIRDIQTK